MFKNKITEKMAYLPAPLLQEEGLGTYSKGIVKVELDPLFLDSRIEVQNNTAQEL